MTTRWYGLSTQQNLTWDHENRLSSISGGGLPNESYIYDADGQRVRKTSNGVNTYYPNQYYEQSGSTITKYYYFNGQRVAIRTNALGGWAHYDLHGDHLGSTVFMTNQGLTYQTSEGYCAYGPGALRARSGNIPLTDHKFTGQKRDGTGLMYYNARYYDPDLGQFLSPDTLVPDPGNLFDYNRYMYTRGNPMKFVDPTGHETTKPEWWPPFLPYPFDLPDGTTEADFKQWVSENNGTTTWGMQIGADANLTPFLGGTASFEVAYMFNWWSGEVTLANTTGVGAYGGSPDLGFQVHGGAMFAAGASSIEGSILGLSEYTTVSGEIEAVGEEAGVSGTWSRGIKNLGNDSIWVPGGNYVDPEFDRTVDTLAVNVSAGVDAISSPAVPVDGGIAHGLSQTNEVFSFNLYSPFVTAWNWVMGK